MLPPKSAESHEIVRKFKVQGHPSSSILVSIKSSYVTSLATVAVSPTAF